MQNHKIKEGLGFLLGAQDVDGYKLMTKMGEDFYKNELISPKWFQVCIPRQIRSLGSKRTW